MNDCVHCGFKLTADEIKYYDVTCDICEGEEYRSDAITRIKTLERVIRSITQCQEYRDACQVLFDIDVDATVVLNREDREKEGTGQSSDPYGY